MPKGASYTMSKEINNMDKFLRGSLDNLEVAPSQNVWKSISKRLLILEIVRLNFTNIGKFWLYSGLATLTTIAGISYFSLSNNSNTPMEEKLNQSEILIETTTNNSEEAKTTQYQQDSIEENLVAKAPKESLKQEDVISTPPQAAENKPSQPKLVEQDVLVSKVKKEAVLPPPKKEINEGRQTNNPTNKVVITEQQAENPKEKLENQTDIAIEADYSEEETTKESQMEKSINEDISMAPNIPIDTISENVLEEEIIETTSETSNKTKLSWWASVNYMHSWPMENTQYLPQTNLYAIKGGIHWKRWDLGLGFGIQSDETNAEYEFLYHSIDSVGFYYDIEYYEIIPDNPDSVIIHYTVVAVSDTVEHCLVEKTTQNSRWIIIPIEVGYELIKHKNFVLKANISARIGWEYYRDVMETKLLPGFNSSYQKIGAESVSPHINVGFGLENQIRIYNKWWFIIEPQIYYHLKSPYIWDGSKSSGPFGVGVNTGIKYKF